jgi:hypothetical protein
MQSAEKKLMTYRLTPAARRTIEQLASDLGLTRTGVIEIAVREMRDRHSNDSPRTKALVRTCFRSLKDRKIGRSIKVDESS